MSSVKKIQGSGNGAFNDSLGRPNPKPTPIDTRSKTIKDKGVRKLNTRFAYSSSRGDIRDHTNKL